MSTKAENYIVYVYSKQGEPSRPVFFETREEAQIFADASVICIGKVEDYVVTYEIVENKDGIGCARCGEKL